MANEEHTSYTTVYEAIGGWQSVLCVWNDVEGIYEPWQTGMGPYGANRHEAEVEAKSWAVDVGIEYKDAGQGG